MKSLKWPAWREASCRLSVKLRSFCAVWGSVFCAADLADGREAEDGRRRAAALGAERADLAEVGDLARAVRDAALEAEAEGRRSRSGRPGPRIALGAVRVDEDGPREGLPLVGLDPPAARPLLDPVVREAVEDRAVVFGPGVVGVEEEETGLGVPVLRSDPTARAARRRWSTSSSRRRTQ